MTSRVAANRSFKKFCRLCNPMNLEGDPEQIFNSLSELYKGEGLTFHNLQHGIDTALRALELARRSGIIDGSEEMVTILAALFHDVGYPINREDHAKQGASRAREVLQSYGFPKEIVDKVATIIEEHDVFSRKPSSTLSQIVRDADLGSFATQLQMFLYGNYCLIDEFSRIGPFNPRNYWLNVLAMMQNLLVSLGVSVEERVENFNKFENFRYLTEAAKELYTESLKTNYEFWRALGLQFTIIVYAIISTGRMVYRALRRIGSYINYIAYHK
ncbi:MAG: HD domain-containing protein [Candidatus Aenigmarchaeota archaeon]|nr:HD domain-containing protein [Candidatus Aenigmarchaeota archaeon]